MAYRTISERTTTSRHFTWIEEYQGGVWNGMRNHSVFIRIELGTSDNEGMGQYEVRGCLPGTSAVRIPHHTLEAAQRGADRLFEEWASSMGLSIKS